jgi:hypothetical protein
LKLKTQSLTLEKVLKLIDWSAKEDSGIFREVIEYQDTKRNATSEGNYLVGH